MSPHPDEPRWQRRSCDVRALNSGARVRYRIPANRSHPMPRALPIIAAAVVLAASVPAGQAAEVKILTAGAMKAVVLEMAPAFEKETGNKAVVENDTAG